MSFAIAAAGTGGHVFPGLAVAEQLVAAGVDRCRVLFIGGDRMEADLVPKEGFPLLSVPIRGLGRPLWSGRNLGLPRLVRQATRTVARELQDRRVRAVLCMGSYVTIPAALAARRVGVPLHLHEQNSAAGLANRVAALWADRALVSFPDTRGMDGEVVGYPLRSALTSLDRAAARPAARERYGLAAGVPTVGVMGGSLGAGAINDAVGALAAAWEGGPVQVVHLAGARNQAGVSTEGDAPGVRRRVLGFEDRMDLFYAASDVVVARAGGGLMEAAVTGTPIILVPGSFAGSHQFGNARAVVEAGAAALVEEAELDRLGEVLAALLDDPDRRERMGRAGIAAARPGAAATIAAMLMDVPDAES